MIHISYDDLPNNINTVNAGLTPTPVNPYQNKMPFISEQDYCSGFGAYFIKGLESDPFDFYIQVQALHMSSRYGFSFKDNEVEDNDGNMVSPFDRMMEILYGSTSEASYGIESGKTFTVKYTAIPDIKYLHVYKEKPEYGGLTRWVVALDEYHNEKSRWYLI